MLNGEYFKRSFAPQCPIIYYLNDIHTFLNP